MGRARWLAPLFVAPLVLGACGDDDEAAGTTGGDEVSIVVTTNILGDVVTSMLGDAAEVTTIMPVGANPHDFQASAQQAAAMRDADLLVVNGGGFEEGLLDVIEGAEDDGVRVIEAMSAVDALAFAEDEHAEDEHAEDEHAEDEHAEDEQAEDEHAEDEQAEDEHAEDEHAEDEHAEDEHAEDEQGHEHEGVDPHFFTDPARMAAAATAIFDAIVDEVPALDTDEVRDSAEAYVAELEALDAEIESTLSAIADDRRILVTNHEVFGYFADRYGFEVVGTVTPSGSTADGASAADLADLAEVVEHEGVPAIFAETSSPDTLAQTLADEVGDVEVVELFSESLGDADSGGATYIEMMRTNADRIAEALG